MSGVTVLLVVSQLYTVLGSLTTIATSQGSCRHGWISFQNSCYMFSHTVLTWPDAEEACGILHSTLATIQTEEEQTFLKAYLNGIHAIAHGYWIDGNDLEVESEWQYSSIGKPLNYTDWGPGEPSNGANEDCLLLWGPYRFQMGDYYCYIHRRFICQQNNSAAPTTNPGWIIFG
ncbi:perlucin-like protein [Pecten maximus]|uniref:perlucin-like protein n=1 Tax=Pecten maximus TaxID=6579 RepID=UPI00145882B3|nr:perlucin-like protein [Pecten maximus]